jgi:hypothetical protein
MQGSLVNDSHIHGWVNDNLLATRQRNLPLILGVSFVCFVYFVVQQNFSG